MRFSSRRSPRLSAPFPRPTRGRTRRNRRRGCDRRRRETVAAVERLEDRLALAIDYFQYPFGDAVTTGARNYAVLVLDQGSSGFLKKNATPSPTLTFADNSQFLGTGTGTALTIGERVDKIGDLTTIYATSGSTRLWTNPPIPGPASPGVSVTFTGLDTGPTRDGIIPGTFTGTLSVTDSTGASGVIAILAAPEAGRANLRLELLSGKCALPTELAVIDQISGRVTVAWPEAPLRVSLYPYSWAVYDAGPAPLSLSLMPGQTPQERLWVDFTRVTGSTVAINSPITSKLGLANSAIDGIFAGAGGAIASGQLVLDATNVTVRANSSSVSLFNADAAVARIDRPVAAPWHSISVTGSAATAGLLLVGEQGALANSLTSPATTASSLISITASQADVVLAGTVNSMEQTYLLNSENDPRPYNLTTVSPQSGVQTGLVKGGTVGITLGNESGGEVTLRTAIDNLRMTASSAPSVPVLPYAIQVSETGDIVVDAVPASQRGISLTATGTLTLTGNVQTAGGLALTSTKDLAISAPISTASGEIVLTSDSITTSSPIVAGGVRGVTLVSRLATGNVTANAAVRAGGPVRQPVVAATTANIVLSGLQTIDGVAVSAGDRVLVKNQADPRANGVYVASAGAWQRAEDADTDLELEPGFTVYSLQGSQEGGWVFANPVNPTLGLTEMAYVPATATQTWAPVKAATTANVAALSGLQTIDGVALAAGDRVLLKNQTNSRQNGIYVVATGAWQRAGDADTAAELTAGSYVFVTGGTTNAQKGFVLDTDAAQVGTTQLAFSPFAVQATRTNLYSPANVIAAVAAATTVNVDLAAGGLLTIDGVDLAVGDRVLVKNQIDATQNGIYVADAGAWTRATDANDDAELARGTSVFVTGGTESGGTTWTFNDAIFRLGNTTSGSQSVTGLASTTGIAVGMLVTGPGIPSGTTVLSIAGTTSLVISKPATAAGTASALAFLTTSAVIVGTTPIVLTPAGGTVVVTAGRSIESTAESPTSRIQGSVAVLNAGRPRSGAADSASRIVANTRVGRVSAAALAAVTIDNSTAVELVGVQSLAAGAISVTAGGTLTATVVSAAGTKASPGPVSLTATVGNLVAAGVGAAVGDVSLLAQSGDVVVTKLGTTAANVNAQAGSVRVQAQRPLGAATGGDIRIDGRVAAIGSSSSAFFSSDEGRLVLTDKAAVTAGDQVAIFTPQQIPDVNAKAQLASARLSYTAPLGASTALPAAFAAYTVIAVNRTDVGDIDITSKAGLTIEAATVTEGSVRFRGPTLKVTGPILAAGATGDIALTTTGGDLTLASGGTLDAPRNVALTSTVAGISAGGAARTPLVTAGGKISVTALTAAPLATQAAALEARLTKVGATLDILETDDLTVESAVVAAGGAVSIVAGSAAIAGTITVNSINASPTGRVKLVASDSILDDGDAAADVVANQLELDAGTGRIDIDTDVNILVATARQENQTVTVDDVGTGTSAGLELRAVKANLGAIAVTARGDILATSVDTAADVTLTSTAGSILVGSVAATGKTVTLTADNSIREATPADPAADITAEYVVLSATRGSIDVQIAAAHVAAQATAAAATIRIVATGDLGIGVGTDGIVGRKVTLQTSGALTHSVGVTAETLDITGTGGEVNLGVVDNDVDTLSVVNGTRAVSFRDADDLVLAAIQGGAVAFAVGGPLSQTKTGSVVAGSLAVVSTAGDVLLENAKNDTDLLSILAPGGSARFVDLDGFEVGVDGSGVTAGTALPGDGDVALTATTGDLLVAADIMAEADTVRLSAPAGTITQTGGTVTAGAVICTAKFAPTILPGNVVDAFGLNLTAPGPLRIPLFGSAPGTLVLSDVSTVDGNIEIDADDVVITGLVKAGGTNRTVTVTAEAGSVTFQDAGRIDTAGNVSLAANVGIVAANVKGAAITIAANDDVTVSRIDATGKVKVSTFGDLVVGPTAGALLRGAQQVDLREVAGDIVLENGGQIIGNPLLSDPAKLINNNTADPSYSVDSESGLAAALAAINITAPAAVPYEITLTKSFTLTQPLTVANRVVITGSSPAIQLTGSKTATNGLLLTAAAAGSTVSSLKFTSFSGTAISLADARNVTLSGLTVSSSGTGLAVSGASDGTNVRGNTFDRNTVAIRLTAATSLTIGGTAAGQPNRITSSPQAGILATGFCTGTQIIKTTFATTPKPYVVQSARNLRIVT